MGLPSVDGGEMANVGVVRKYLDIMEKLQQTQILSF
jgi:hypothetical protein